MIRKVQRQFDGEVYEEIVECGRCSVQAPLEPVKFGDPPGNIYSIPRNAWYAKANTAGWQYAATAPLQDAYSVGTTITLCPTCGPQFAALLAQKAPAKAEVPKPTKALVNPYNKFEVE
jgi:hypothetical protein